MTQNIRYKLHKSARFVFSEEQATGKGKYLHEVVHENGSYFLDILEVHAENFHLYRARVYLPNGEIILGLVLRDYVEIHNYEQLFDGRFNAIPANLV